MVRNAVAHTERTRPTSRDVHYLEIGLPTSPSGANDTVIKHPIDAIPTVGPAVRDPHGVVWVVDRDDPNIGDYLCGDQDRAAPIGSETEASIVIKVLRDAIGISSRIRDTPKLISIPWRYVFTAQDEEAT